MLTVAPWVRFIIFDVGHTVKLLLKETSTTDVQSYFFFSSSSLLMVLGREIADCSARIRFQNLMKYSFKYSFKLNINWYFNIKSLMSYLSVRPGGPVITAVHLNSWKPLHFSFFFFLPNFETLNSLLKIKVSIRHLADMTSFRLSILIHFAFLSDVHNKLLLLKHNWNTLIIHIFPTTQQQINIFISTYIHM